MTIKVMTVGSKLAPSYHTTVFFDAEKSAKRPIMAEQVMFEYYYPHPTAYIKDDEIGKASVLVQGFDRSWTKKEFKRYRSRSTYVYQTSLTYWQQRTSRFCQMDSDRVTRLIPLQVFIRSLICITDKPNHDHE